jgi:predicted HAD superfamily phosphohydrolase YqeG
MFSILVEPIDERDFWYTKWKRPMENWIIKKYLKTLEK